MRRPEYGGAAWSCFALRKTIATRRRDVPVQCRATATYCTGKSPVQIAVRPTRSVSNQGRIRAGLRCRSHAQKPRNKEHLRPDDARLASSGDICGGSKVFNELTIALHRQHRRHRRMLDRAVPATGPHVIGKGIAPNAAGSLRRFVETALPSRRAAVAPDVDDCTPTSGRRRRLKKRSRTAAAARHRRDSCKRGEPRNLPHHGGCYQANVQQPSVCAVGRWPSSPGPLHADPVQ
jgi:hypothetical protein